MISCEQFISHISELIEDELDAAWRQSMLEHTRQCRNCFVVLDTTRRMIRLVGDPDLFELPPQVSGRLHDAIELRLQQECGAAAVAIADPAPQAGRPARPRLWWTSPRMVWATAAMLLVFAGGLQWLNRARTVSVGGWLTDEHCYPVFRSHPQDHPRTCMLISKCQASGFGVIQSQGNFLPFDKGATSRVVAMLEATSAPDHIWVNARGHEHAGVLKVTAMEVRTPDQRVAWSAESLPRQAIRLGMVIVRGSTF